MGGEGRDCSAGAFLTTGNSLTAMVHTFHFPHLWLRSLHFLKYFFKIDLIYYFKYVCAYTQATMHVYRG